MGGCGKSPAKKPEPAAENNAPEANKPRDIAVATGPATNSRTITVVDPKTHESVRRTAWEISWQQAQIAIVNGQQYGAMFKVTGSKYEEGAVASSFSSDRAEADKAENRLILEGHVTIRSQQAPKATMTAKRVEWLPELKVFKATGGVTIEGDQAVIGPMDSLYVSPKLHKIGSSLDYFKP